MPLLQALFKRLKEFVKAVLHCIYLEGRYTGGQTVCLLPGGGELFRLLLRQRLQLGRDQRGQGRKLRLQLLREVCLLRQRRLCTRSNTTS